MFRFAFSEAVDIDGVGLRSALVVSGGPAADAQPVDGAPTPGNRALSGTVAATIEAQGGE